MITFIHNKTLLLIFVMLFVMTAVGSVHAEEKADPVCQVAAAHISQSDVAYQAGIDAYGNAVVPADLNATAFQVPNVIKVPLNIDLAQRLTTLVNGLQLEAPLGMLEIYQDGKITYNGQDWTAPVMTLCGQSHKQIEEEIVVNSPVQALEDDGQNIEDVIKSPSEEDMVTEAVEILPTQAIPPAHINIGQIEVDPPIDTESDVVEGGEYREMYYNE